ncbi:MAG TPA: hypothetical protein DCL43_03305 [Chitinophagaceae bacterium]|nr:hypothetical protein [Chitinophagaceae bacterium]HAN39392.1 hypothetical protein [Chitinophagaceae bacterium]
MQPTAGKAVLVVPVNDENMQNTPLYFLILLVSLVACRPVKRAQKIEIAVTSKDTVQRVVVDSVAKVDSSGILKDWYQQMGRRTITFNTFYAKVKVDYNDASGGGQATAFIRMKKDSVIWVSLNQLGIEGYRLLVTRDSVYLMNKLKNRLQVRSIQYLQELTELPLDFEGLQDVIIGNPVFVNDNIISYKKNDDGLMLLMLGDVFKHLITLDNNFNVVLSKLDDANELRNRTCVIRYSNYEYMNNIAFATNREISVAEKSKLDVTLEFKNYTFNQPLTFPFNVPSKYKRM